MAGLYGFSSLSLDTKGRIVIPARYKDLLKEMASGSIIITRDPQYPSLLIYPGALWKKISDAFENLSGLNPKIRSLQWNFLGNAHAIDFEVSERMTLLIPQSLRNYSQIKVVLIGMGQKLELWSEKNWKLKEEGKNVKGERLEIELPSEVQEIPF
jgi:MraZ protein